MKIKRRSWVWLIFGGGALAALVAWRPKRAQASEMPTPQPTPTEPQPPPTTGPIRTRAELDTLRRRYGHAVVEAISQAQEANYRTVSDDAELEMILDTAAMQALELALRADGITASQFRAALEFWGAQRDVLHEVVVSLTSPQRSLVTVA